MFDGFKISVSERAGLYWLESPLLSFKNVVNISTGEILDGKKWATYKGLTFTIKQSTTNANIFYYNITGSFHKYHNKGLHNYNDYFLTDFLDTLNDLKTLFKLDLKETILHRLEFGLNLELTTPIKPILDGIRAYKSFEYSKYKPTGISNFEGVFINTKRNEIKIYNKAKEYKQANKNIIRFEYVLKDKEVFTLHKIFSLYDLRNQNLVLGLGKILFDAWNDTIFFDGGINIKNWTPPKAKKFLRYLDAKYWSNLNKKQRYRSKQDFFNIIAQNDTKQTQQKTAQIIAQKWYYLTAVLCPPLGTNFDFISAIEMSTFGTLVWSSQRWTFSIKENNPEIEKKALKKDSVFEDKKPIQKKAQNCTCKVCKKPLEQKRQKSKYCSKKCNNTLNGLKRTLKRKNARKHETENLAKLISKIPLNKFWLLVTYKSENLFYTDYLHQSEINAPPETIRQINKIVVTGHHHQNKPPLVFTTLRAKALIININHINKTK